MDFYTENFIEQLHQSLPPIFTRETACKMMGGIFTPRTLSNFDAAGKGPEKKIYIGRKVAYEKNNFIDWFSKMVGVKKRDIGKKKINPYW